MAAAWGVILSGVLLPLASQRTSFARRRVRCERRRAARFVHRKDGRNEECQQRRCRIERQMNPCCAQVTGRERQWVVCLSQANLVGADTSNRRHDNLRAGVTEIGKASTMPKCVLHDQRPTSK